MLFDEAVVNVEFNGPILVAVKDLLQKMSSSHYTTQLYNNNHESIKMQVSVSSL